jgi:hypothetical protein
MPPVPKHSRILKYFTKSESSYPCSQKPSSDSYPELCQPNPYHRIRSKIHFNIILTSMPRSSFLLVSFFPDFRPKLFRPIFLKSTFYSLNKFYCFITILKLALSVLIIYSETKRNQFKVLRRSKLQNLRTKHNSLLKFRYNQIEAGFTIH